MAFPFQNFKSRNKETCRKYFTGSLKTSPELIQAFTLTSAETPREKMIRNRKEQCASVLYNTFHNPALPRKSMPSMLIESDEKITPIKSSIKVNKQKMNSEIFVISPEKPEIIKTKRTDKISQLNSSIKLRQTLEYPYAYVFPNYKQVPSDPKDIINKRPTIQPAKKCKNDDLEAKKVLKIHRKGNMAVTMNGQPFYVV